MNHSEEKVSTAQHPHPFVWLILYIPFGALGGFVGVALTFLATKNGLSITEGALLVGSQLLVSWLKWLWAPLVDITLSPKKWYLISTIFSGVGVWSLAAVPLSKETLSFILLLIALANIVNSVVGMSVEAMISSITPKHEIGRVSAWFQAGNLGGAGLGGALGLYLLQHLSQPWLAGAVMALLFGVCCLALLPLPAISAHVKNEKPLVAIKAVALGFWDMVRAPLGVLTALLCVLPVATAAAQITLTQAAVAAYWGAGAEHVEWIQGVMAGLFTVVGCFMGGWVCQRFSAHRAYSLFGVFLALIALGMGLTPATVTTYVVWNIIYSWAVGLAYAAFTSMALIAIDQSAAATGYNVFASLSNLPLWWLGLLLGWVADRQGPRSMLFTEAALGGVGVLVFMIVDRYLRRKGESMAERTPPTIEDHLTPLRGTH